MKKWRLVGYYHSRKDNEQTHEQGKIELLSRWTWTAEMSKYSWQLFLEICSNFRADSRYLLPWRLVGLFCNIHVYIADDVAVNVLVDIPWRFREVGWGCCWGCPGVFWPIGTSCAGCKSQTQYPWNNYQRYVDTETEILQTSRTKRKTKCFEGEENIWATPLPLPPWCQKVICR